MAVGAIYFGRKIKRIADDQRLAENIKNNEVLNSAESKEEN